MLKSDRPQHLLAAWPAVVLAVPDAHLLLQRKAPDPNIHNTLDGYLPDVAARRRQDGWQQVHHKARVDAQANDGRPARSGQSVQLRSLRWVMVPGEGQFFTCRDHGQPGVHERHHLGEDLGQMRLRRVQHDVGAGGEHSCHMSGDGDVWRRSGN